MFKKIIIAALAAGALALGAAAPASAHYGDWYTQYQRTSSDAYNVGLASSGSNSFFGGSDYVTSGAYGAHSRYFVWGMRYRRSDGSRVRCSFENRIDHDYNVFTRITHYCVTY